MISSFFIWCSGASIDILKKCPETEWTKFVAIGANVFMTALFSFISFTYAANEIFQGLFLSIVIGLFWGVFIFTLDRFLVITMTKTEKPFKDFLIAMPRIILSLLIAIVIAKPLELRIFQDRISEIIISSSLPNDFIAKMQVYTQLQESNNEIRIMSMAILLLFIVMELSPVLLRLISSRGPYDKLLSKSQQIEISFLDKTKNDLNQGNVSETINNLFHIAELNNDTQLEKRIKRIAIQIKYLEEEMRQNSIDENFASKEIMKSGFELRQIIQNLSDKDDMYKFPNSHNLKVEFDQLPKELQERAIKIWK